MYMKSIMVTAVIAVCCQGCLWNRMKVNDPTVADRAKAIVVGTTKGEELPTLLGAQPTMRMPGKGKLVQGYTYSDTKTGGLMLIIFNFTRSSTDAETLYVEVDAKSDIVTGVYIPPERQVEWRFWPFGE